MTDKEDFLEVDRPVPGQNYACLSFISPENVLKEKELYLFHKFMLGREQKLLTHLDKAIKNAFLKFYDKNGVGPGQDKLKDAVTKSRESKIKQDARDSEIIDNIADMIYSPLFQEKLQHSTPKEIDSKLQSFLA